MTSADSMLPDQAREGSPFAERPATRWDRLDAVLGTASEYLNPILVKETRQALKSKQFLITFTLLLILGWGWSLLYLSIAYMQYGGGVAYAPHGVQMLIGYYWVLSFPLIIIVPFTAFRSLSVEREDGTHELVSITTLRPYQIVGGKLGSAVLQMLIYLSALAPCMAFTYMLRGLDLMLIVMVVGHLFLFSVFLSVLGLCFATVTTVRHWQMVLGVIFILMLVLIFLYSLGAVTTAMSELMPQYHQTHFWSIQLLIITVLIGYGAMLFLSALSRITFDSDNRSTKLRWGMFALHLAGIAWGVWLWMVGENEAGLAVLIVWAAIHWWLMGSLMVGERADVSPRVRRQLPGTFLGRSFLSWFYPGPGSGYMLASMSMLALFTLLAILNIATADVDSKVILLALFMVCYVIIYVGITRLVMLLMQNVAQGGIFLSLLLGIVILLTGTIVPLLVQMGITGYYRTTFDYSVLLLPCPFAAPWGIFDNRLTEISLLGMSVSVEVVLLTTCAGCMLILNMLLAAREVDRQREAPPQRVLEEEAALHPEKAKTTPNSPWDEDAH